MFTLSVCMIVRDEELVIDRILTIAEKFADQIVVVDTGSKDKTIEICKQHNCEIYKYNWTDNFADARNFSFSKANQDYIMWLDADDYITKDNIEKILKLKNQKTDTDVFMIKYAMNYSNNKPQFEFYRERILKTNKNFKWEGFVHEVITPTGKIEYTDITIEHRKVKENPKERNLKIYRNALKSGHTFTPREQYYYSRELYFNGYFSSCIKSINKYLKMKDKYIPNIIDSQLIKARCFLSQNKFTQAKQTLLKLIDTQPPQPETCCLLGETYENINNYSQAIFWYKTALISDPPTTGFIQAEYNEFIPYLQLCKLYFYTNKELSFKYHNLAKSLNPNHPSIIFNDKIFQTIDN